MVILLVPVLHVLQVKLLQMEQQQQHLVLQIALLVIIVSLHLPLQELPQISHQLLALQELMLLRVLVRQLAQLAVKPILVQQSPDAQFMIVVQVLIALLQQQDMLH